IAPFGDAVEGALVMPAKPYRHLAAFRARVDAGVVDRVPAALEDDMRLGPQRLHEFDLLFRAAAAVVEILVEPGEFDLVPTDPDAEAETAAAQDIERGGLLGDERGLALRQDQDAGGKAQLCGAAGEIAKQDKRVVEQTGAGA